MKIELWSVGKPHESYAKMGIEDFSKRITNYFPASWHIMSPPKNAGSLSESALKKAEAAIILQGLDPSDYLVPGLYTDLTLPQNKEGKNT